MSPRLSRLWFPRRRPAPPADGTMAVLDHLHELRRRLLAVTLAVAAGTAVGFLWFANGIPAIGLPSLGDILTGPYCAVPAESRVTFGDDSSCQLLATGPFSAVELQLKSALIAGSVLTAPIWLHQLWAFVTPALHARERRYASAFGVVGGLLFAAGAVLAYLVIREGLTVLLEFGGDSTVTALSPESYFSFLIAMLIIFGVSFELPLLLIMLNSAGVLTGERLARSRRYAIFGLVVFAGLVVPGNDPITMGALAVALILLYEVAVQVTRRRDRRIAGRRAEPEPADCEPGPRETVAPI
ncbi:twin-arginine translocase subunit TatC [Nakamurella sp.]|uniref:twin-arginine translocase subunit TatC n=1 Tax=Nakamurella sp. TaxID=1869182 RepID=UPI003784A054